MAEIRQLHCFSLPCTYLQSVSQSVAFPFLDYFATPDFFLRGKLIPYDFRDPVNGVYQSTCHLQPGCHVITPRDMNPPSSVRSPVLSSLPQSPSPGPGIFIPPLLPGPDFIVAISDPRYQRNYFCQRERGLIRETGADWTGADIFLCLRQTCQEISWLSLLRQGINSTGVNPLCGSLNYTDSNFLKVIFSDFLYIEKGHFIVGDGHWCKSLSSPNILPTTI